MAEERSERRLTDLVHYDGKARADEGSEQSALRLSRALTVGGAAAFEKGAGPCRAAAFSFCESRLDRDRSRLALWVSARDARRENTRMTHKTHQATATSGSG